MSRGKVLFGLVAAVIGLSGGLIHQEGAAWRIPEERQRLDPDALRHLETDFCDAAVRPEVRGTEEVPLVTCARDVSAEAPGLYVWGDSHARHLVGGLATVYPDHNIRILYFTSCLAQSGLGPFFYTYEGRAQLANDCRARNQAALAFFEAHAPTTVILHQYFGYEGQFSEAWFEATTLLADQLRSMGHQIVFVGGVVQPGEDFVTCYSVPGTLSDDVLEQRCQIDQALSQRIVSQNNILEERFPDIFINPNGAFCKLDGVCAGLDGDTLLFRDRHHLSIDGSVHLVRHIADELERALTR